MADLPSKPRGQPPKTTAPSGRDRAYVLQSAGAALVHEAARSPEKVG
jgi:hypothetical protein